MSGIEQDKGTEYVLRIALGLITLILILPIFNAIFAYFLGFYLFPIFYDFRSSSLFYLILVTYYIYQVIRVETLGQRSKTLWIIRFILVGFISMPIFWFFFVWRKEEYALFSEEEKAEQLRDELNTVDEE